MTNFIYLCKNGHLCVAQWLYSLDGVNIHARNDDAFRWACYNDHLHVAQWLYSLGGVAILYWLWCAVCLFVRYWTQCHVACGTST